MEVKPFLFLLFARYVLNFRTMNTSQGANVNNVPDMSSNCDTHNCIRSRPGSHVNTMRKVKCADLIIAAKTGCADCVKNMI